VGGAGSGHRLEMVLTQRGPARLIPGRGLAYDAVMRVEDRSADEHLGAACPSCGWRRGQHRPQAGDLMAACELAPQDGSRPDEAADLPDGHTS
jgi:hypothetical protein